MQIATLMVGVMLVGFGLAAAADLADACQRSGTRLVLCDLQPVVAQKLERAGVLAKLGEGGVVRYFTGGLHHASAKKDARQEDRRA